MAAKNTDTNNKDNAADEAIAKKPLSVARNDLMNNMVDAINNSYLPIMIVEYVVKDLYMEVRAMAQKQYDKEQEEYNASL